MGRRVRVPTDNDHSRLCDALLGTHHVNDALTRIVKGKVSDAVLAGITRQKLHDPPLLGQADR